ncbi:MAG: hypothetical protein JW951_08755 [Lentisphaerae bacterium]|nr:hypothetical protein [Lentisphaerota bacterium]
MNVIGLKQWAAAFAGCLVIAAAGSAQASLVAHYEFEETGLTDQGGGAFGPVEDSTGNQSDAAYVAAAGQETYIAGVINQSGPGDGDARAFHFDRENTYGVNTYEADLIPATGDFTVLVSFKTTYNSSAQQHDLISCNNGQTGRSSLMVINNTLLWFHQGGVTLASSAVVNDGAWHVAGIAREGDRWDLYLDGNVVNTGTSSAAITQTVNWRIGVRADISSPFDGEISDVKVYNHYAIPSEATRVAHYKLEETRLTWNGSVWTGVKDASEQVGFDGAYWGPTASPADSNTLHDTLINQPGPGTDGDDRAYRFSSGTTHGATTYADDLLPADGSDFTIFVSFKTTNHSNSATGYLFNNYKNSTQLGRSSLTVQNGKLKWFHGHGAGTNIQLVSKTRVDDGNWHVGGVGRSNDLVCLYLDGAVEIAGWYEHDFAQDIYWMIGRDRDAFFPFDGYISDIQVYDRFAIPAAIPFEARLQAHYALEETQLTWSGSMWTGIEDSTGQVGADGAYWGFGLADSNDLHTAYINRPGPGKGDERAYRFDRSDTDGIATYATDTVPCNHDFTIAVWFKTSDSSANQLHMFSNNAGSTHSGRAGLYVLNGNLRWWHENITGGELVSAATVSNGKWHMGGVTREGDDWKLFLDGEVVDSTTSSDSIGYIANAGTYYYYWCIGRSRNGNPYDGYISDVKVYNVSFIPEMPPPYGSIIMIR